MRYRNLSSTALMLPELGFGASRLVNVDLQASKHLVGHALNRGIHYFDTAPFYGLGQSEIKLGAGLLALGAENPPYLLSTKVGRILTKKSNGEVAYVYDYSSQGIEKSLRDSLERLEMDHVDMVLLHDISLRWHGERVNSLLDQVLTDAYKTLLKWRESGKVKAIGLGINDCQIALRALREADLDFLMLAGRTTFLDQEGFNEVLPLAKKMGKSILAAAPFNSGILASGAVPGATYFAQAPSQEIIMRTQRIEEICKTFQVPMKAASLQMPLSHPSVCSVVVGYQEAAHIDENIALCDFQIDPSFWKTMVLEGLLLPSAVAELGF
jgi:D-threo-aldose 1-dehydrogenase